MYFLLKMVIFHCYVSLPESISKNMVVSQQVGGVEIRLYNLLLHLSMLGPGSRKLSASRTCRGERPVGSCGRHVFFQEAHLKLVKL